MSVRRKWRWWSVIAVAALLAAGCGDDATDEEPAAAPAAEPAAAPDPEPEPEPAEEPAAEPAEEPAAEPDPEPAEEPAGEPAAAPVGAWSASLCEGVEGTVEVLTVWTSGEGESFDAVLDQFRSDCGGRTVNHRAAADEFSTVLATTVEGGNPPDIAMIPGSPSLIADYASRGDLIPLDFMSDFMSANFTDGALSLGEADGVVYGFPFKGSRKSIVWYNVDAFATAGVSSPATWEDFILVLGTLSDAGITPVAWAGGDVWPLADLFEDVYLRTAGQESYLQLAYRGIPWTDQSVKDALAVTAEVIEHDEWIALGREGALELGIADAAVQIVGDSPGAAILMDADYIAGIFADETDAQPFVDYDIFPFPSIEGSPVSVKTSADITVMFKDNEAAQTLMTYLASATASEIWAGRGGFTSFNTNVSLDVYPDDLTRSLAEGLAAAEVVVFDIQGLTPPEFGWGAYYEGMTNLFLDPSDIDGTAQLLEDLATEILGPVS